MYLLHLPEEILREIFNLLDFDSKLRAWEALPDVRFALKSSVFKTVHLAGDNSVLSRPDVVDLAPSITVLNLSGLHRLNVEIAETALPNFTNLKCLDVSKVLSMYEAARLCNVCPKLTTLASHFDWPLLREDLLEREEKHCADLVTRCQHSFRHLRHVTFDTECVDMVECGHMFYVLQLCHNVLTLHINILDDDTAIHHHHFQCLAPIPPSLRVITTFNALDTAIGQNPALFNDRQGHYNFSNWQMFGTIGDTFCQRNYYMTPEVMINVKTGIRCYPMVVNSNIFRCFQNLYILHEDLKEKNPTLYENIVCEIIKNEGTLKCVRSECFGPNKVDICLCSLPAANSEALLEPRQEFLEVNEELYHYGDVLFSRNSELMQPKLLTDLCNRDENFDKLCVSPFFCINYERQRYRFTYFVLCFKPLLVQFDSITFLCIMFCRLDESSASLFHSFRNLKSLRLIAPDNNDNFKNILANIHRSSTLKELVYIDFKTDVSTIMDLCSGCPTLEQLEYRPTEKKPNMIIFQKLLTRCPFFRKIVIHHSARDKMHANKSRKSYLSNMKDRASLVVDCRQSHSFGYMLYDDYVEHDPFNIVKQINV